MSPNFFWRMSWKLFRGDVKNSFLKILQDVEIQHAKIIPPTPIQLIIPIVKKL